MTVTATDPFGTYLPKRVVMAINVADLNEDPTITGSPASGRISFAEGNTEVATAVGLTTALPTYTATDPEGEAMPRWSVVQDGC